MKKFALVLPLEQLAAVAEGKLIKIRECTCNAVASLEEADENTVVFFQDTKFEKAFAESKAGIFLIPEKLDLNTLPKRNYILCSKPYFSFLRIVAYFLQSTQKPVKGRDIHPTAIVAESVIIPDNITIAANAVIGENSCFG